MRTALALLSTLHSRGVETALVGWYSLPRLSDHVTAFSDAIRSTVGALWPDGESPHVTLICVADPECAEVLAGIVRRMLATQAEVATSRAYGWEVHALPRESCTLWHVRSDEAVHEHMLPHVLLRRVHVLCVSSDPVARGLWSERLRTHGIGGDQVTLIDGGAAPTLGLLLRAARG